MIPFKVLGKKFITDSSYIMTDEDFIFFVCYRLSLKNNISCIINQVLDGKNYLIY